MSIKQLHAKLTALYNETEEETALKKATRYVLNQVAQIKPKKQLIRSLEADHCFSHNELRYVLHSAIWDLKH